MAKKKIGRIQDAEIKKQLRIFAKKEFNEKKPLEIRVLQIKPGVIFKKGSMLPNLMIKNLVGSAFVIYLEYGDQLKFYYFSREGRLMGGSNFDKSEKLLKEMHGKAKTLLKLPKVVKIIGLEEENQKIKERWERLTKKYSHELGIAIKNLPAISVKKNIPKNTIRIGIEREMNILHFDYSYYNSELQDIILLREFFSFLTNNHRNIESHWIISTIWALTRENSKQYMQILNKISLKKSLNKKALTWIKEIFLPYIEDNPENKDNFAEFLLRACIMIDQRDVFTIKNLFDLFLLWLMKFGTVRCLLFFENDLQILKKSWLYFEMLELLFTKSDLCRKYGINPNKDRDLVLIHLCSRFVIGKESQANREFLTQIIPNYLQMETALENLEYCKFNDIFTKPFFLATLYEFFQETLLYLLSSNGIIVDSKDFEDLIELPLYSEKEIEILIQNKTDWILKDVGFHIELIPQNRIKLQKIDPPKLQEFAGDLKLKIIIKSTDKTGKCRLTLKMSFEDQFYEDRIKNMLIKTINIGVGS